jgi:hypothetical protein
LEAKPVSDNRPQLYDISKLKLDSLNPRLPEDARQLSQSDLLEWMDENYNLLPLARSMSDNGYFDEEPLIVIPRGEYQVDEYIVIEGNRRLAALKLLTDPNARAKSKDKAIYEELAANAIENLTKVPAVKYAARQETVAMLGFRHIAGIKKWSPISKAEFVYKFANDKKGMKLAQIARVLGDNTSSIKRSYATYCILLQAEKLDIDTANARSDFSVFYTALGRVAMQDFIGVKMLECENQKSDSLVPHQYHKQLEELIMWVHGTESVKAIVPESRELKKLATVLKSKEALERLRDGGTLDDAFALTMGENQAILTCYKKASFHIEESLRFIHRHKNDPEIHSALLRCTQSLAQALKYYPDVEEELTK